MFNPGPALYNVQSLEQFILLQKLGALPALSSEHYNS